MNFKALYLLLIVCHCFFQGSAQTLDWAITQKISTGYSVVIGSATDATGNIYLVGNFGGTTDFDPGPDTLDITSQNGDMFIQKLDSVGNLIWVRTMGRAFSTATTNDIMTSISIDDAGNIYSTGFFQNDIDFDPGPGTHYVSTPSLFNYDGFIHKMDSAGNFIWVKILTGPGWDVNTHIEFNAGSLFVSGYFEDSVDVDPGVGVDMRTSMGQNDALVQKLDTAGNLIWARTFGGGGFDQASTIKLDQAGNIYVSDFFQNTVDFDPGAGTTTASSQGETDSYLLKLDPQGDFIWVKTWGGTDWDGIYSMEVDNSDNVIVTGYFLNTVDFDPGPGTLSHTSAGDRDIFISKFNAAGDLQWSNAYGNWGLDHGAGVTADASGCVYVMGTFQDVVDFDPGVGVFNLPGGTDPHTFIQKLDPAGNLVWARQLSPTGSYSTYGYLEVLDSQKLLLSGMYQDSIDLDPGNGLYQFFSDAISENADGFLARWGTEIPTSVQSTAINEASYTLYPNPATDIVHVSLGKHFSETDICLYSLDGKQILRQRGQHEVETIDIQHLSSGMYFIRIVGPDFEKGLRLIKR